MKKVLLVSISIIVIALAVYLTSATTELTAKNDGNNNYSEPGRRPQILKVTLLLDNGETRVIDVKKQKICALFWGNITPEGLTVESSAASILGSFYDNMRKDIVMTREKFNKEFGNRSTQRIFSEKDDKIIMTKELIRKLWETPNSNGDLPVYIGKSYPCHPVGDGG